MENKVAEKIKNQQQVAKSFITLRQLELDKTDTIQQIDRSKEELNNLDSELVKNKSEAERKKRELANKKEEEKRAQTRVNVGHGSVKDQKLTKLGTTNLLTEMYDQSVIDRDFAQKERECEQKKIETKRRIVELDRKRYRLEREFDEETNVKRAAEKILETLRKEEEIEKRKAIEEKREQKAKTVTEE